jgi:hypothetical protein
MTYIDTYVKTIENENVEKDNIIESLHKKLKYFETNNEEKEREIRDVEYTVTQLLKKDGINPYFLPHGLPKILTLLLIVSLITLLSS